MNRVVIGGVDTHAAMHCAAVIDGQGRLLAVGDFAASADGYRRLATWADSRGRRNTAWFG